MRWCAVLGALASFAMTASAIVHDIEEIPCEINGRKIEVHWQEGDVRRGEAHDERNLILVEHPVPGTPERGRPLYVVLHSAGHDAFSTLMCTRTEGNHDIYHPPADFYALYLDCRANAEKDWWWGAKSRKGFDEVACEKRVIDTVVWAIAKYNINSNRVYLSGNSMGGSGTLGIGLRHGDIFAAIKANVPAIKWFNHPVRSLGLNLPALPEGAKLPDPPVAVDYSAQNDDWSTGHAELIRGMRERKYQWMLFWGTYGHANDHAQIARKNDIIHSFDWLSVRLDQPYPAFTDCSTDDPSPWPDDRRSPKPGQINGFFRWDNARSDAKGVSMDLRLATAAELKSRIFSVPTEATATVTVRRLGKFAVRPGDRLRWQFGKASGELTVGADALVTVPKLTVTAEPAELSISRMPPDESAAKPEAPFCALRFGYAYTQPGPWAEMRAALKKNPGAFDEVWFSTGINFPKLAWHERHAAECAAAAADLRAMGIVPSIEIQTIIGHTDGLLGAGDCSGQDWGTWVGADGTAAKYVSCPHDPRLAAYFARVGELYAAWKPGSMWIDDDVTLRNRAPMKDWSKALFGCFCARCIGDFEKLEGRKWPREELAAAIRADKAVAQRWEDYQCGNFAALCKAIAAAVHKVSPETVFGYQYGYSGRPAIVKGIYDGCGIPVRLRPGAGAYWDTDAHQQLDKAYQLQWLSELMGHPDWIGERCPEIETCPRTFACRTPQGVVLEAFENLALGLDFLSMFVADTRGGEATEFYADRLFPRIRAAMPFLRGYRDASVGTLPCGFTVDRNEPAKLVATRGLPIVGIRAKTLGPLPDFDTIKVRMGGSGEVDRSSREYQTRVMQIVSSTELTNFYARCDRACGYRLPVRFERPVMAFALPRVKDDGTLVTLALINASIDRQEPVRIFLRGLPAGCGKAVWRTPEGSDAVLSVERREGAASVILPLMGAWACGYLDFRL